MRLPEVRARLEQLALSDDTPAHISDELFDLIEEMRRRRNGGRGRSVCRKVTDEVRQQVRDYYDAHPEVAQLEIANRFNINQGRVSEILHGFRE